MGEIVSFEDRLNQNLVKFEEYMDSDPFLKLTAINALEAAGFSVTEEGVKQFQEQIGSEPTGIMNLGDFGVLIQVFDPETKQTIISYLDDKSKANDKTYSFWASFKVLWWLGWIVFFFLYGAISFAHKIFLFTRGLFQ